VDDLIAWPSVLLGGSAAFILAALLCLLVGVIGRKEGALLPVGAGVFLFLALAADVAISAVT
jgi:hypothetical protein